MGELVLISDIDACKCYIENEESRMKRMKNEE